MQYKSGRLIIRLVNSYKHVEQIKNGKYFISTKKDKHKHGIGLLNVERTVEKYNGMIDMKLVDNRFEAMVILYCWDCKKVYCSDIDTNGDIGVFFCVNIFSKYKLLHLNLYFVTFWA